MNESIYKKVKIIFTIFAVIIINTDIGFANSPEYIALNIETGKAYEVEGYYEDGQSFIATDIEVLPKPRKPKLRGIVDNIDFKNSTISIFGKQIRITSKTEFIDDGSQKNSISNLKLGKLVQVTCRIQENGNWKATKIKLRDVKKSKKIKGTVTKVSIDGIAPDTIEVSGLIIILNNKTDVNDATSHLYKMEKYLFGDLQEGSVYSIGDGYVLNNIIHSELKYRQNWFSKKEYDLSQTINANEDDSEHDFRLQVTSILDNNRSAFFQMRLRKRFVLTSDQNIPSYDLEADITQLFFLWHNIQNSGIAVSVGRQNFEEPREWLFDDYMDAVRVFYYGQNDFLFESAYITAINPIKDKFDTWTDIFGQASWYFRPDNKLSAYYLKRSDTSLRNREPKWIGFRYIGEWQNIKPWAELSFISGEDKGEKSEGTAYDFGATFFKSEAKYNPSVTIAYAFGSGDDPSTPLVNERFRQTGYQDNVSVFNGQSSVYYYGNLLDPELSNLKIITFGIGIYPTENISVDFIYHSYTQEFPDNDVKGSNLYDPPARPNGSADDIGTGFDIIAAFPIYFERVEPTLIISTFQPGIAFDPYQESATFVKLNLNFII